jgi:hypothetical protein
MHSGHKMYFSLSARTRSSFVGAWKRRGRACTGGTLAAFAAATIFILTCSAGYAAAADLFDASPITASKLMSDTQAAEPAEPTPGVFSELRDNLHVSGYIQSNYGLFYNTEGTKWWPHHHLNSIESLRQLGQIDLNESFGEHLQFFARFWGVYEPSYPFENDARIGSKSLSDFYNEYAFRDLWLKIKEGPLNLFIGKQIVEWGESLAFRVGDQINPQDVSYAFGFNNLEASHLPIWMLHPILNLPAAGPFSSNFFETVYAPGFDFLYNHVDYPDDRYQGQNAVAGRVDVLPIPADSRVAGGTDNRFRPGESLATGPTTALQPPFSYVLGAGFIPDVQWAIPRATFANSQIGLRLHTLIKGGTEVTAFYWRSFDYTPNLYVGGIERPVKVLPGPPPVVIPGLQRLTERYVHYESFGGSLNRPLPLPIWLANELPLVLRMEFFYKNHDAFSTSAKSVKSGIVNSDTLNTLVALDLDQVYAPWLTSTGSLTGNFEFQEVTILDASDKMLESQGVLTKVHKHEVNVLANLGTSFYWGAVAPTWTTIYNPDGQTFLLTPSIVLTPPWTNKYFAKIGTVYILGNDKYAFSSGGSLKGGSSVFVQLQYNFDLL